MIESSFVQKNYVIIFCSKMIDITRPKLLAKTCGADCKTLMLYWSQTIVHVPSCCLRLCLFCIPNNSEWIHSFFHMFATLFVSSSSLFMFYFILWFYHLSSESIGRFPIYVSFSIRQNCLQIPCPPSQELIKEACWVLGSFEVLSSILFLAAVVKEQAVFKMHPVHDNCTRPWAGAFVACKREHSLKMLKHCIFYAERDATCRTLVQSSLGRRFKRH